MFSYQLAHPLDMGWELLEKSDDFADRLSVDLEHGLSTGWLDLESFQEEHREAKKMWRERTSTPSPPEFHLLWFPDEQGYLSPAFVGKDCECNGLTLIFSSLDLAAFLGSLIHE